MSGNRVVGICLLALCVLCFSVPSHPGPAAAGQAAQAPEKPEQHQHQHGHQMNLPSGASDKCEPKFTYEEGPLGPDHWEGVCNTGHAQSPVDIIAKTEKMPPCPSLRSNSTISLQIWTW
jgi:hypothetical protein